MVTSKPRISSAVRVLVLIALAEELGTAPVRAELELVLEVAVQEPAAESLAIGQAAVRARVIVPGVELELVIALAKVALIALAEVLVLVIVLAKAVLLIALVEVREPEIVQVEAGPERDPVAVPLKTKSVTGRRRHDQVLLLAVVDLAVEVVETTRERAVAEAVIAWEVAE
jgi:hypothetical protein